MKSYVSFILAHFWLKLGVYFWSYTTSYLCSTHTYMVCVWEKCVNTPCVWSVLNSDGFRRIRKRETNVIMNQKALQSSDLVPPIRHVRNHHSLAFETPFTNTDIYKCSFFPQTIRGWNSLIDTLLSAAEGAEDSVAKFTSLVRVRD